MIRVLIEETKGAVHIKTLGEVTILDTGDQLGPEHEFVVYLNGEEMDRVWAEPKRKLEVIALAMDKLKGEKL